MKKRNKRLPGFTLIEMLVVMSILIILGTIGMSTLTGFRETISARENIQTLKQDVQVARNKAMFIDKGGETKWIYGIGIDFSKIDTENSYRFFRWCSTFDRFGDPMTESTPPGFDSTEDIGEDLKLLQVLIAGPEGGVLADLNGILPYVYTNPCYGSFPSLTRVQDGIDNVISDVEASQVYLLADDASTPTYVLFEAITGRAFLYDSDGYPMNYESDGTYNGGEHVLDIVITRRYSSKFALISIYPRTGAVITHVYSDDDLGCATQEECITVEGSQYDRYTLFDEINSYRSP